MSNIKLLNKIKELEAKDATISELHNEIKDLNSYETHLQECLDEKNKDVADLAQELREVKEKLSKSEAWNGKEEEE